MNSVTKTTNSAHQRLAERYFLFRPQLGFLDNFDHRRTNFKWLRRKKQMLTDVLLGAGGGDQD